MRALALAAILCLAAAPLAAAEEVTAGPATIVVYENDQTGGCFPPVVCEYIEGCEPVSTSGPYLDPLQIPPIGFSIHEECIVP